MVTSIFKDHISQIPALQMLVNLGSMHSINQSQFNKPFYFIEQNQLYNDGI